MEQVAAVCYRLINNSTEYLLVRTHSGRWTFPKGKVEPGEERWCAAQREAFEEAGVTGVVEHESFTTYIHSKKEWEDTERESRVKAFLLDVKKTGIPEEQHRSPSWFSFLTALAALSEDRPHKYAEELRRVLHEAEEKIIRPRKNHFKKFLD